MGVKWREGGVVSSKENVLLRRLGSGTRKFEAGVLSVSFFVGVNDKGLMLETLAFLNYFTVAN